MANQALCWESASLQGFLDTFFASLRKLEEAFVWGLSSLALQSIAAAPSSGVAQALYTRAKLASSQEFSASWL